MSIISRGRTALASLLGIQALNTTLAPQQAVAIDDNEKPVIPQNVERQPVAVTKGRPRYKYFGVYNGGKHRRRVPVHIMQDYVEKADLKRERKNAKRYIDHTFAEIQNPCVKFSA